jgi:glycosyltransferase involved in cell wall biosynthesis
VGGQPDQVAAQRENARAEGLRNLLFTGFISQRRLPAYQAAADILLMPYARSIAGSSGGNSADICSPMKMFDYLAAGRPIITSDLPVIREVLHEGNAVFAQPEDIAGWASALAHLLMSPELRDQLGRQARCDAQNYTWAARAERALAGFVEK